MISSSMWAVQPPPAKSPPPTQPPLKTDAMPAFADSSFSAPLIPNLLEDLCLDAPPVQARDDAHMLPRLSDRSGWDDWLQRVQGLARIGGVWEYVDPKSVHRLEKPAKPTLPLTPSFDPLQKLQHVASEQEFEVRIMEHKLKLDLLGRAFAITQERYRVDCLDYTFKLNQYTAAKEELDQLNKKIYSSVKDEWRCHLMNEDTSTPRLKLMVLKSLVNGRAAAGTTVPKPTIATPAPPKPLARSLTGTAPTPTMTPVTAPLSTGNMTRTMTGTTTGTMAETQADSVADTDSTSISNRKTYDSQYERLMDKLKYKGPRDWQAWAADVRRLCEGCEELSESQLCDQMAKDAFFESIELYYQSFQQRWTGYFDNSLANGESPAPFQDVATDFIESELSSYDWPGTSSSQEERAKPMEPRSLSPISFSLQQPEDDKMTQKWCPGCEGVHLIRGEAWWRTCWVYHEYMGRKTAPKWFKTRQDRLEAVRDRLLANPNEEAAALEWNSSRKTSSRSEQSSWR